LNNKEIHYLTKQELAKKIDLIIFSDFYQLNKMEEQKKRDFGKVLAIKIAVKGMAKDLKNRFRMNRSPAIVKSKVIAK
jgi:hypothetical protein